MVLFIYDKRIINITRLCNIVKYITYNICMELYILDCACIGYSTGYQIYKCDGNDINLSVSVTLQTLHTPLSESCS